MQYNVIRYDTIRWYNGTVSYGMLLYNTVHYGPIWYNTIQYDTVWYCTIQFCTIWYSTTGYSTIQYSTVRYSWYNTLVVPNGKLVLDSNALHIQYSCFHSNNNKWKKHGTTWFTWLPLRSSLCPYTGIIREKNNHSSIIASKCNLSKVHKFPKHFSISTCWLSACVWLRDEASKITAAAGPGGRQAANAAN